jgi:hypothetical protein
MKAIRIMGLTAFLAAFLTGPALAAVAPVGLGTAGGYAVLAYSTVTNTGPTTITGDVGLHPGSAVTGFGSVTLHGTQHVADGAALQAKNDLVAAYNSAAGRTPTTVGTELGGQTFTAGVYNTQNGELGLTGVVTLDAQGDPNAVFIFQAASTLTTASGSRVVLVNGSQACNVFWKVTSSATLGTSTAFAGNILALASITLTTGATLVGRALAQTGAVTLDTNVITRAVCSTPAGAQPTAGTTPVPGGVQPPAGTTPVPGGVQPPAGTTPVPGAVQPPTTNSTPPPTTTGGSGDSGSGPGAPLIVLIAGLAAAAAFVTVRRLDTIRR